MFGVKKMFSDMAGKHYLNKGRENDKNFMKGKLCIIFGGKSHTFGVNVQCLGKCKKDQPCACIENQCVDPWYIASPWRKQFPDKNCRTPEVSDRKSFTGSISHIRVAY